MMKIMMKMKKIKIKMKKSNDDLKYADADEESVEIFNQAKTIAQEENISFKEALLKVNTKEI